jgi:PAS domain S-box-containing protein
VRRPERALREARETLELALDAGELGTFDVDLLRGRVVWDARTCRIFGVDPSERVRSVEQSAKLFHPADRPAALRAFREALGDRAGGDYRVEKRIVRPDGVVVWVATRGRTYFEHRAGRREAVRMVGVVQDVTEGKRAERAFAREARMLSLSHDAVVAWRLSGEVQLWNRGAQELYGLAARHAVGRRRRELLPSRYPQPWEAIEDALRRRGRWHGEARQRARSGRELVVSTRMQLFVDDSGPLVLEVNRDVTDERAARDALEEANRHKDEFMGLLGHELRNPLAAIVSALAVQRELPPDDARQRDARDVIARQAAHMKRLIEDLLDVTRVARGKIELRRAPMDLAALVRAAAQDHAFQLERAQLTLELEAPPEPVLVDGDEVRLAQVVANLLANAGKFTAPRGRVALRLRRDGDHAVLTVEDDGAGMDEEVQRHLFEPFRQGRRTAARTDGGLGLGLSLVRGITTLHGGEVEAFSPGPGRGARFTVRLPLARPAELSRA